MTTAPVTQLRPPRGSKAEPPPPNRWTRRSVVRITPAQLAGIFSQLERGETEPWADTCEYMLRTDTQVRSTWNTLLQSVASAEIRWEPSVEDDELAQAGADFLNEAWDKVRSRERTIQHLLHGEGVGWSVAEHEWQRVKSSRGYAWLSLAQHVVMPRDVKFDHDWIPAVRSWVRTSEPRDIADHSGSISGVALRETWHRTDEEPARWLVHVPGAVGISPQMAGILCVVAWPWLFKRWNQTFRQQAMERFGAPTPWGTTPEGAEDPATEEFRTALEKLSAGHAIVVREGQTIELIEPSQKAGEAFDLAIQSQNEDIAKGILGSTLNTEGSSQGNGSRALGESQADTTILPRVQAMAGRLEQTLENDFARPTLGFNAKLFGGRVPPMPRCRVVLEQEAPPVVDRSLVDLGVYTANEIRRGVGLDEWTEEQGGGRIVTPVAKSAPAFERGEVGTSASPFGRTRERGQLTLPLTSTRRKTSPTSATSATRTAAVPWPESGDPGRPPSAAPSKP